MAKKIAISNQKGGVGKTTTALAIAAGLIKREYRVLMVDCDPQRNTSHVYKAATEDGQPTLYDIFMAGDEYKASDCIQHTDYGDIIANDESLKTIDQTIAAGPKAYFILKKALAEIEDQYDFILFDTPPHVGLMLGNALTATDSLIIPVSCDAFSAQGLLDFYGTVNDYRDVNPGLEIMGIVIVRYKNQTNLSKDIEANLLPKLAEQMGTALFETRIRESVKCQEAQSLQMSLFERANTSTSARDYRALIDEIFER